MSWRGKGRTFAERTRDTAVSSVLRALDPELAALARLRGPLEDVVPPGAAGLDQDGFVPETLLETPGIDYREEAGLALLERWGDEYGPLFEELRADPTVSRGATRPDRLFNGQFHTPDAEIYAALIADRRPQAIVEIGAGYSTRIARRTISTIDLESSLMVIDPEPRAAIETVADRFVRQRIEDATSELVLDPGSFLFIDSSHVVRSGGDVPLLLGQIVPALQAGVVVHVHDVFLPWDYPDAYRRRLYTEQYLLQALLTDSARYRVLFATHVMARRHAEAMRAVFGPAVGVAPDFFGSSFWFEVNQPAPHRGAS